MQGRPRAADSRARHARFLELVAAGSTPYDAAREARLDPWRALRLAGRGYVEHDLGPVVAALRQGAAA